ncbi:elongation factor EF-2 [Candidatus Woesearchaeota archaeon]|nr:elongation factor EF-2 [Candidatus Woesearchaeota archaeon]
MAVEETRVEQMKRLAGNPKNIRNIATSAHIHHGKCVAPNTRLFLSDGRLLSAKELYEQSETIGIKVRETEEETVYDISDKNVEVFSLNKVSGKLEKKQVSHAWKLKGGSVIHVELRNKSEITTTPEHKYLVLNEMEFVEKEAQELRLGDRLVCARKIDINERLDMSNEILLRLSVTPCYAKLSMKFGQQLKEMILKRGLKQIHEELYSEVEYKSFYHGIWQNRYTIKDLIYLAQIFNFRKSDIYANIATISFRRNTKSTKEIKLPTNFENLFYLAGLFFGDGSHKKFIVGKEELKDKFISICKEIGIKAKYVINKNRTPEILTNNSLLYLLHTLFDYPLKQKSHNIKINNFIFSAKKEYVAKFIQGYFDCDGTVENARRAISVTSVSKQMLKDLQLLLLRFSCLSIINDNTLYITGVSARKYSEKINFKVESKRIKTSELIKKTQGSIVTDTIPLSNDKLVSVRKVSSASIDHHYYKYEKGILTPTLDTVLELKQKFAERQLQTHWFDRLITGDLSFIEIVSLEQRYEPIVYDFSVPDYKNFIAEGIVIHNTALTDNLIAAAGLMSAKAAGSLEAGMETWQHKDEQERLMTVDAANVSMAHKFEGEEFLINLIDTPGHIDFGGNVTRAMRAIDGTVVLVCGSEGIMPQTETVLKQALRERVKPVLFINKVDRLMNELQLNPEAIQKRFTEIIIHFNRLIEQIAEKDYKEKWKVNFADGSVAFGSARDNWALSLPYMQKKGVTFKDVQQIYELQGEERHQYVWEKMPVHEVILDMVIKHLPNPIEAQKYRIPKIWRGEIESEMGKSLISCDPNGKLAFVITRITIDPKSGRELCAGRLYGGTMREGMQVYLNNAKMEQRVGQVLMYQGIKPEIINDIPAGNVLAIAGIIGNAGETVTDTPDQPFEEMKHIFEPVITKSISPTKPQDISKMVEVLKKVAKEDPSVKIEINQETGENLIHGMGELHLEIIEGRIKEEKKLEIKTGPPIVVYRETVNKRSIEVEGKSPNKHNKLYFIVEPLELHIRELIKNGELPEGRVKKKDFKMRDTLVDAGWNNDTALSVKDIYKGNIFLDATRGNVQLSECLQLVIDGFEQVIDAGPLAREPSFGVKIILADAKLHEDAIHRGPAQMYPAVRDGIKLAFMNSNPVIFEPVQTYLIEAPIEFTGEITKLVMNKRGSVLELNQEGAQCAVKAKIPVAEMIGWSSALRSATSGRGQSSLMDQTFEKVPQELQNQIIQQIIKRKGLSEGQVGA